MRSGLRRKKAKKKASHNGEISETQESAEENQETTKVTLNSLEKGQSSTTSMKHPTAEQKRQYERFARHILSVGVDGLLREYNEQLKIYVAKEWKREISDKNLAKHRYKLLVCNDLTRVVIADGGLSDYIHANHVRTETCKNKFICTQSLAKMGLGSCNCLKRAAQCMCNRGSNRICDFWRMVLHFRSDHVVMLCNVIEDEKSKCEQYWPLNEGETMIFGDITIRNVKVAELDEHIIKTALEVRKGNDKQEITHIIIQHAKTKQMELIAQQVVHVREEVKKVLAPMIKERNMNKDNVPSKEKSATATVATNETPLLPLAPPLLIPVAPQNVITSSPLKVHVINRNGQPPSSRSRVTVEAARGAEELAPKASNERSAAKKTLRSDKERVI